MKYVPIRASKTSYNPLGPSSCVLGRLLAEEGIKTAEGSPLKEIPLHSILKKAIHYGISKILYTYLELIIHECLHCLICGEAESIVESRGSLIAVLGTLPEQALVVAEIWGRFHL